jgi:hypothetical protein
MPHRYPFLTYVLIATPKRFSEVAQKVSQELKLSPSRIESSSD